MTSVSRFALAARLATFFVLVALVGGCASQSSTDRALGESASLELPAREEVSELASEPAPEVQLHEMAGPQPAERWELVTPLPSVLGHLPRQNLEPWERGFADLVDSLDQGFRSEASTCVARQNAHYYAANGSWPDSELDTFIDARCGWIGSDFNVRFSTLYGDTPLEQAGELAREKIEAFVYEMREKHQGAVDFGLWIERFNGDTKVFISAARRQLTVEPRQMTFDGRGTIEGRVHNEEFDFVRAYITDGPLQARTCLRDPAARFPEFRFHCGGDSPDQPVGRAYFELSLDIRDQPWVRNGGTGILVSDLSDTSYVSAAASVPALSGEGDALQALTLQLNAIRTRAGMRPVEFSEAQSRTVHQLFPHLLEAQRRKDAAASRLYINAVIAGWDIDAPILSGKLLFRYYAHNTTAKAMAIMLTSPGARQVLFDERLSHIGLASIRGTASTSLAIAGYLRVPDLSGDELVSRALKAINDARDAAGNRPIYDSENYQQAATLLSGAIARGTTTPTEATDRIVNSMARNMGTRVYYYTLTTDDLDAFPVPEELITASKLRATVLAAPYQHPDDPWSIYRVVIMYADTEIR